jgi:hypothetical protein
VARYSIRTNADINIEGEPTSGPVACLPKLIVDPLRNALALFRLRREVEHAARGVPAA